MLILLDFKSLGICTSVSAETTAVNREEKPVPQGFAGVSLTGHTPGILQRVRKRLGMCCLRKWQISRVWNLLKKRGLQEVVTESLFEDVWTYARSGAVWVENLAVEAERYLAPSRNAKTF